MILMTFGDALTSAERGKVAGMDTCPETPSALALARLYASLLFTVKQCRTNEQMQKQS